MKKHGANQSIGCPLYSVFVPAFAALEQLPMPSAHTVMLILADARGVPDETISKAAEHLLNMGLVYVCVWGPDCERVHDLFDWANVSKAEKERFTLMSTWHRNEPLDEAIWFFIQCAFPPNVDLSMVSNVAVAIGNADWASSIEAALSDFPAFKARVLATEGN